MPRLVLVSVLALLTFIVVVAELACSRPRSAAQGLTQRTPRHGPALPDPLPIPQEPELAAHIADPAHVWSVLSAYAPTTFTQADLVGTLVAQWGAPSLVEPLRNAIDFERPWAAVQIGQEIIVRVPVLPGAVERLQQAFGAMKSVGPFGAVRVDGPPPASASSPAPPGPGQPRLAWLEPREQTLTLAHTLRGIATGTTLPAVYGDTPLFFTGSQAALEPFGVALPMARVVVRGQNPFLLEARFERIDRARIPDEFEQLGPGALTSLLQTRQVVWGASSRWTRHEKAVQEILSDVRRQVAGQNFLIRGILEELARRLETVLLAWDGRVLIGGGPSNHLVVALGTGNAKKAEGAVLHLLQGVVDNLKLASTFGMSVPDLKLERAAAGRAHPRIHRLTVRNAHELVPRDLAGILDGRRALNAAFVVSAHGGSALAVMGPQAPAVLASWMRDTARQPPASASSDHWVSASWAVDPRQVRQSLEGGRLQDLLTLDATRPPAVAVLRHTGNDDFVLTVGPPSARPD